MGKILLFDTHARKAIRAGVDFLADAVRVTEGPRGRNVILGQRALGQTPKVTRDGVTVANYVDPVSPDEQLGADLVREAAQKTDNAVGDGTTASIVLAQKMIDAGFRRIDNGANPVAMEKGIRRAVDAVIDQVRRSALPISPEKSFERVFQVATVSAHGDKIIGELVADALAKAGQDGVVTAEPSSTSSTYIESVAGLELPKSNLLSPVFITHPEDMHAELLDARILLWEGVIATAKSLVPILKQVQEKATPLLIVAGGYEQEALAVIINNKARLALPIIAVRMESYGERRRELLLDIAALTGGEAFTEDRGFKIEQVKLEQCGVARKVITTMAKTQIIDGRGNQAVLAGRVDAIRQAISSAGDNALLKQRLAALLGGITLIKVGGVTVTEMEEKKDRVIDAMSAARAAVESGIVPGGGTALLRAAVAIPALPLSEAERPGGEVVAQACQAVFRQIVTNAGLPDDLILSQIMATDSEGFNVVTEQFEDLLETGIIDPASVVIESLKNAAAVACSILTTGAAVVEILKDNQNA